MSILAKKVAVITGGATGIGQATTVRFSKEGANVVYSVHEQSGDETAQEIIKNNGNGISVHADVSKTEDVKNLMAIAFEEYGEIDIVVSNAGLMSSHKSVSKIKIDYWDKVIDVNLKGCFLCAKSALPYMIKNSGGSFVNITSISGLVAFQGEPAYGASKAGIMQLTRSIAVDYAKHNIRANCLAVGIIDNDMTKREMMLEGNSHEIRENLEMKQPLGRMGTNEEVAAAALFLACGESSFITGTTLVVDGGLTAKA